MICPHCRADISTAAAREALIAAYAEKARREIVYGSSEFAGFYARSAAHYALRYR